MARREDDARSNVDMPVRPNALCNAEERALDGRAEGQEDGGGEEGAEEDHEVTLMRLHNLLWVASKSDGTKKYTRK